MHAEDGAPVSGNAVLRSLRPVGRASTFMAVQDADLRQAWIREAKNDWAERPGRERGGNLRLSYFSLSTLWQKAHGVYHHMID